MQDDDPDAKQAGNEPAPLLLIAVAFVPLLAVAASYVGLFG